MYFPASSGLTRKMIRVPSMRMRTRSFRSLQEDTDVLSQRVTEAHRQDRAHIYGAKLHQGAIREQQRVKQKPAERGPKNTLYKTRDSNKSANCHNCQMVRPSWFPFKLKKKMTEQTILIYFSLFVLNRYSGLTQYFNI